MYNCPRIGLEIPDVSIPEVHVLSAETLVETHPPIYSGSTSLPFQLITCFEPRIIEANRGYSEHLTRVHNASARCIYCNKVWSTPNWEQELQTHYPTCPQKDKIMSKPECMSAAQEAVYKSTTNEHGHPDKRWVLLFLKLFPGKYPIPSPRECS